MKNNTKIIPNPTFREIRYKEKKRNIIKKAARLFFKRGYNDVTIEDIAAGLKLTRASLYHYFKSKDELLYKIQMQAADQAEEALERVMVSDLNPVEKLREAFISYVEIATRDPLIQTLRQQEFVLPPKYRDKVIERRVRFEKKFMELIQEGVEKGYFDMKEWKVSAFAALGAIFPSKIPMTIHKITQTLKYRSKRLKPLGSLVIQALSSTFCLPVTSFRDQIFM